jgi:hypothetical protein
MRKIVISLLLFMSFIGYSQTNGITYQALILNPNGEQLPGVNNSNTPLANTFICLKFTIIDQNSLAEYIETARTTTDEFGMVNLIIGTGERIGGYATSFSNVLWNANPKSLKVELSATGTCYTYVEISYQPFTSVPFALFAVNSQSTAALAALQSTVTANAAATTSALALKEDAVNKSTTTTLGTSDVLFPTQNAVKTYVDSNITTVNTNTTALQTTVTANASNTTAALATKENAANKSTTTTLGTSDVLFPTQNAVKTYVDSRISSASIADADATTKGKIQLAGDLAGTAALPVVANNAIITAKIADASVTDPKIVGVSGSKVIGNISGSAANVTGIIPVANGGTGVTSVASIKSVLGLNSPSVAIGDQAGQTNQGSSTVGVGGGAGATNQGGGSVAVGYVAGYNNQGNSAVAIGSNAAQSNQGTQAVAVGYAAGQNGQGANSVAVGAFAGNGQAANSIALNATGAALNPQTTGFYVAPVRNASESNSLFYNTTTKEITYGTAAPTGPLNLATGVAGILPVANGGTGSSTKNYVDLSTAQTIAGAKVFSSDININGLTFGKGAGSNNGVNTAIGASALAANTTGVYNTAIGFQVLANNTTGNNNHALGFQVLAANTTGSRNTALGEASLPRNTTGSDNVAIGLSALFRNTTADNNIAIGTQALGNSLTGSNNVAIGSQTLTGNSTGSNNTAVGYQSLQQTSGSDNTAIGRLSLMSNTTGSSNTAIGSLADVNSNNLSNTTAIGYGARALANNTIQLGADGSSFVTNGLNTYTTAISNVRTSGTLTLKDVTYPNTNGTAGQVLTANNNGNATWTTIASVADASTMTGTVAIDKGGTGATTATAALTNLGAAPTASPVFTGTVTAPIYASTPQVLTAGATINWNPINGLNASVTLNQNSTLSFTATPAIGSYGTLVITQDASGGRTITLPSTANKVLGSTSTTTITLSSAAGAKDILNFYYDGSNCYWNVGQGYGTATPAEVTNLTSNVSGTLAVANGGTGATTLTGLVKGSGTSALTAAVAGTDYQAPLTLTTTGSGAATLSGTTLNIPATTNYSLPTASASALGGVKVGTNLSIDGTGVLSTIAAPTFTGAVTAPIYASTPQALNDAATISWNPSNGLNASVTLAGNRTLSFTTTPAVGSYGTLVITQDGTGGRTITLPSALTNKVLGSTSTNTVTLSSAAGAKDILNFYYDGTNCYWNVGQGYGTAATAAATNLASSVSGNLPIANGGTGATTKTTAFDALSPMTTSGDIIYGGANGTGTRLSKGSNGSILTMENDLPTWNTSIKATAGSSYNAPVGFSFIGGDWARNTGMFSDNPDSGASATLKFRIATSNSTANSYLEINPSKVSVLPTTASTSKTTGALTVAGGLGVDGNIYTNNLNSSGTVTAGSVTYPNAHGTANQVLSTTGSGTLTWTTPAAVRLNSDEFNASAAQTSFTLTQTALNAKVFMFINGTRIKNGAFSVSGTTVTYSAASNNSYALVAGDRVQFDYAY